MLGLKPQIEHAISIALLTWQHSSGQLSPEPMGGPQFCCKEPNRTIEDEGIEINAISYKLSTPSSNWDTQQAQKHPNSV